MEFVLGLLIWVVGAFVLYKVAKKLFVFASSTISSSSRFAYDHRDEITTGIGVTGRAAGSAAKFVGKTISKGAKATAKLTEEALRERRTHEIRQLEGMVERLIFSLQQIQEPELAQSVETMVTEIALLRDAIARQRDDLEGDHFILNHVSSGKELEKLHTQATHIETELRKLTSFQETIHASRWQSDGSSGSQKFHQQSKNQGSQSSQQPKSDLEKAFSVLELDSKSSPQEIKKKYRQLLKIWHTDKAGDDAELYEQMTRKTQEINNAYDIIKKAKGFK